MDCLRQYVITCALHRPGCAGPGPEPVRAQVGLQLSAEGPGQPAEAAPEPRLLEACLHSLAFTLDEQGAALACLDGLAAPGTGR